jgi:hypothetical protein
VAIVASDPGFAARPAGREAELVRALLAAGVRRVVFQVDPGFEPDRDAFPPGAVVVPRAAVKLPARPAWRFTGPPPPAGVLIATIAIPRAEAGLHRRQILWLPGENSPLPALASAATGTAAGANPYWLRLSRNQNLPRIEASQVLARQLQTQALGGAIALVEPSGAGRSASVATPRDRPGSNTSATEFQALSIQTLATGRAVGPLDRLGAGLLLVLFALASGLIYLRSDPKRILPLLVAASLAVIGAGTWLALEFANVLLPATALTLSQLIAAPLVLLRAEVSEDRSLRRFVTRTINLSSRQVLLKDLGRLPGFLAGSAPLLGIERALVVEETGGQLVEIEALGASLEAISARPRKIRAYLRRARRSQQPVDAAALVPDWRGTVRLAALGPAKGEVYWLYAFAPENDHAAALHGAAGISGDYRSILQLRADLSAGGDHYREYRPADEWAGGAVRLIADQGQQVASGLDTLETAVAVYHPIGFPLHANAAMIALCEQLDLVPADTALPQLLAALTHLDPDRIAALANDLLLHGGEMRVDAREIDTRMRQARIAAVLDPARGRPLSLTVEVIDISEPRRLAQLRLTLANLLDVSIRNDLVAIGFALASARSGRLGAERLDQALASIAEASERATGRLDALAPHLHPAPGAPASQSFPIDAKAAVEEAEGRVAQLAAEMQLEIEGDRPAIAGFTIADPQVLADTVEAMLRIVLADSAPRENIRIDLAEEEKRTRVTISGGIGMAFERLYAALENAQDQAPGPFRTIAQGMTAALGWGAVVSYSSRVGKGYRFVIEMRRIG